MNAGDNNSNGKPNEETHSTTSSNRSAVTNSLAELSNVWGSNNTGGMVIDTALANNSAVFREATESATNVLTAPQVSSSAPPATTLPADQERQVLLLMLLAQVCALHDATPRTFTVHVLELLERGLLENAAVSFLFDLGLVPSPANESSSTQAPMSPNAIRNSLQLVHRHTTRESWSVQEHPLSLSRYQREFRQVNLLASGSFGQVYSAVNKLDGATYAVKRVVCEGLQNFDDSLLRTVLREVQCLAASGDHAHVVRYYTAWLEPSWMTGDTTTATSAMIGNGNGESTVTQQHMLLLTNGSLDKGSLQSNEESSDWIPNRGRRTLNQDVTSDSLFDRSDCSDWSIPRAQQHDGDHDNYLDFQTPPTSPPTSPSKQQKRPAYRYEVCLYIQMQLCQPTTLVDWIRQGPHSVDASLSVFQQLVDGLAHIHACGIVHRDLKPANVFQHTTKPDHFLLGDFGLSTLAWMQGCDNHTTNSSPSSPSSFDHNNKNSTAIAAITLAQEQHASPHYLLTAGIGTATYAAPEQVSTRTYGPSADIFSLGLVLLEICMGPMDTDHERLLVLGNVRHRRCLPQRLWDHPMIAQTILDCTEPDPSQRPTASDLKRREYTVVVVEEVNETVSVVSNQDDGCDVNELQRRLEETERELQQYKTMLAERDATITELREQLASKEEVESASDTNDGS